MNTVSPMFDACAAGSLANVTLCAASRNEPQAPAETEDFEAEAKSGDAARPAAGPARWRRLVDTILSPISGPTLSGR